MRIMVPDKIVWEKKPSLIHALGLEKKVAPVISVVGAGGKTSTIEQLAKEYEIIGKKVIITTTTHMFQPEKWTWCKEESMEAVDKYLEKEAVLWLGVPCEEVKMMSPRLSFLERIKLYQIPMLIEADGARRLPFKVPGDNEPVILEGSHVIIGVLGMDAFKRPMKEVCFHSELAAEYLHKPVDSLITENDYVEVVKSNWGLKKGVTKEMDYIVILNKVDNEMREKKACLIRDMLQKQGIRNVYLTSLR